MVMSKRYVAALACALATFAAAGGIHATETAVKAEMAPPAGKPAPAVRQLGVETSIPFLNHGGVRNWREDGSKGLYVQDMHGQWYYAALMGPCPELPFVEHVGFETRGLDRLDKFGAVIVRGQKCAFSSFVTSNGPPQKAKATAETPTKG